MHAQARPDAHDNGTLIFYIHAVDKPTTRCSREWLDQMRAGSNIFKTAKIPGLLPAYMGFTFTESMLLPRCVRGISCVVVRLESHAKEPPISGRSSIAVQGYVVLHYLPKAVYVESEGSTNIYSPSAAHAEADLQGLLAMTPNPDHGRSSIQSAKIPSWSLARRFRFCRTSSAPFMEWKGQQVI